MSSELIISEVQKHPSLWNPNHVHYHNRLINDQLWSVVGDAVNLPKETAKTRWKSLRDSFNRELRKTSRRRSGLGEEAFVYKGKWSHFDSMSFLKDVVTPRNTECNIPEITVEESCPVVEETDTQMTDDVFLPYSLIQNTPMTAGKIRRKKKSKGAECKTPDSVYPAKRCKTDPEDLLSESEKGLLKNIKEKVDIFLEPDDDDTHFFKSLLPYFKQMTPLHKLKVRLQIQQLVLEEICSSSSSVQAQPN